MGKVESILSSSITAVFFTAFLISALMWYGSAHTTQELFGPTRYSWDNAYYSLDIRTSCSNAWNTLPDKLVLYDYIGSNPAKGGLFRSGPMLKADGLVQNWLGHACFSMGTLSLSIRRMPAFFGQIFTFDKKTSRLTDGVFRTSARGWYSFSHIALAFSFFQDIWTGVTFESQAKQEYGRNEKLGDKTSSTKTTL